MTWEPWPDNMPLVDQVKALGAILMEHYGHTFDRSEGAMEKAARLLWEARRQLASDESAKVRLAEAWTRLYDENEALKADVERFKLLLIEATNPGIDMDKVRAERSAHSDGEADA